MSNRSLIEINHDYCPKNDDAALLAWAKKIATYIRSGSREEMPDGIRVFWRRHHSDPCPFEEPLAFERSRPRSQQFKSREIESAKGDGDGQ